MTEPALWKEPVAEGCFMVGKRHRASLLQCNTYLRTFPGKQPYHWCIDPGSRIDYPTIRKHLLNHVGDIGAINLFSINHQDPDVVGNLTYLLRENPDMEGLSTQDTWRLVRHLNVHPEKLHFTNKLGSDMVTLRGEHRIRIVPTPFCHFRGAVAYYDVANQVLFSGDLFGGLNKPGRVHLYAEAEDWAGIAQFHQIYMPSRKAVAYAIRQIRALRPAVKVIAPQHGFLLRDDFMHEVLDRLIKLPMGMDLLPKELDQRHFEDYKEVAQDILALAVVHLGRDEVFDRLRALPRDHKLLRYVRVKPNEVPLKRHGIVALPLLVEELGKGQPESYTALLKSLVLDECLRRNVPLPEMGIGIEGALA